MAADTIHTPVLLERCIELLSPALVRDGAVLVDATLGLGGHAEAFLTRMPSLVLVGIDRDADALGIARDRLAPFADRIRLVHAENDDIGRVLEENALTAADGVLFDLGVSSMQLETADRGFSYSIDAPLDMRMDTSAQLTAAEIIATYSEGELRQVFREYGEEPMAARYAKRIVETRAQTPLTRSGQLVEVIQAATPRALGNSGHPAKRVFQALRIEVNQELAVLERAIPAAIDSLATGGRIAVLSFQSLEDRIVKRALVGASSSTTPAGLPVELPGHEPELRLLVRGSEQADDLERAANPRSASVRLRAAERVRGTR